MKKGVNELKDILLNKKMSFLLLDNILDHSGYYSVFNDRVISYIKNELKVIYTAVDTGVAEIEIFFEITEDCGADEIEESFYLRATDIKRI